MTYLFSAENLVAKDDSVALPFNPITKQHAWLNGFQCRFKYIQYDLPHTVK